MQKRNPVDTCQKHRQQSRAGFLIFASLDPEHPWSISTGHADLAIFSEDIGLYAKINDWKNPQLEEDEFIPGPYTDTGNRFSAYGLTPPVGIDDQGDFTATLIDIGDSNIGSVGPGDGFDILCEQVWINDQTSEDDFILDGSNVLGYTDVVNNNVTTRIGFEPYDAAPGGVFLNDFTEYFTMTDGNQVLIDTTFNIKGAFSIVFLAP